MPPTKVGSINIEQQVRENRGKGIALFPHTNSPEFRRELKRLGTGRETALRRGRIESTGSVFQQGSGLSRNGETAFVLSNVSCVVRFIYSEHFVFVLVTEPPIDGVQAETSWADLRRDAFFFTGGTISVASSK